MPSAFRTPAHGTRVPEADDVAAQIAESLAARQQEQAVEASSLSLVLTAIQEVKTDVKTQGATLNGVLVEMATMNGDTRVLTQKVSGIDESVKVLSTKMASVERGGSSTAERPAIRGQRSDRGDGSGWISASVLPKIIAAVFSGLALIAGAYFTGRGHGAQAERDAAPAHAASATGHTPP